MKKASESRVKRLFNGDYVKVRGVSPALIDRVQANIKEPKAPIVLMNSGEELPNYQDPEYQEKLREVEAKRSVVALNAVILFGLELCDEEGNPIEPVTDRRWEKSLKRMGIDWEREMLDMQGIDEWEDDEDREWAKADAYMLFTAFSGHKSDLDLIRSISGADIAAQAAAEAQFPG